MVQQPADNPNIAVVMNYKSLINFTSWNKTEIKILSLLIIICYYTSHTEINYINRFCNGHF